MNPLRNLVAPTLLRDVLSGEALAWTADDWLAVPQLLRHDAEQILARVVLASLLGRAVASEVLIQRAVTWAKDRDCDVYCLYHGCDALDCPPGSHVDPEVVLAGSGGAR